MNNEIFEAYSFLKQLFSTATSQVIIIDSYVEVATLDLLTDISVPITFYTLPSSRITNNEIAMFQTNHSLNVIKSAKVHDRFIIIDDTLYAIGASLKDAGKKLTTIHKLDDIDYHLTVNNLK